MSIILPDNIFKEYGPLEGIIKSANYSLRWFVEQTIINQQSRPFQLEDFQAVILNEFWHKQFPLLVAGRGTGKTLLLALYSILRLVLTPGSRIIIAAASFRQSKLVFREIEKLYNQSPLIQEALKPYGGPKYHSDTASLRSNTGEVMAIPLGDGSRIRGLRANFLLCDEFASISEDIFEIVLKPFTATHMNPTERTNAFRFLKRLQALKVPTKAIDAIEEVCGTGNQVIMSGTASYKHNHFYRRYQYYKSFISCKGDIQKLKTVLQERALVETGRPLEMSQDELVSLAKSYKQYSVIQLPYYALPEGFLDINSIRDSKATFSSYRFKQEYEACFPDDTDGFIKRSQIDAATPREDKLNNIEPVYVELYGDPRASYVLGVDPARWNDNIAAVVLKLTSRGRELVYCDAWNRSEYNVTARRIREIFKRFHIVYFTMDSGGGGSAVQEWLCKKVANIDDDELVWPVNDQLENPADIGQPGKHVLEMVNFGGGWSAEAAHALEANINHMHLLFPGRADIDKVIYQYLQHFSLSKAENLAELKELLSQDLWGIDKDDILIIKKETGESLEVKMGIWDNINECINEVCAITKEVTPGGVERFILPKLADQPEGLDMRRRDRFSALMLANYAAKVYLSHGRIPKSHIGTSTGPRRGIHKPKFRRKGKAAY